MAAGVVLLLFGAVTALLSLQLPIGTLRVPGSGFFPLALGLILAGLAACQILQLRLRARRGTAEAAPGGTVDDSALRVLLFLGIMALATALLNRLGYPLVAFLLMVALLQLVGVRGWRDSVLIALLTAGACYLLFVRWLQIPLPKGWPGL
jgi:putative tricarboxylic transport membrane protein